MSRIKYCSSTSVYILSACTFFSDANLYKTCSNGLRISLLSLYASYKSESSQSTFLRRSRSDSNLTLFFFFYSSFSFLSLMVWARPFYLYIKLSFHWVFPVRSVWLYLGRSREILNLRFIAFCMMLLCSLPANESWCLCRRLPEIVEFAKIDFWSSLLSKVFSSSFS